MLRAPLFHLSSFGEIDSTNGRILKSGQTQNLLARRTRSGICREQVIRESTALAGLDSLRSGPSAHVRRIVGACRTVATRRTGHRDDVSSLAERLQCRIECLAVSVAQVRLNRDRAGLAADRLNRDRQSDCLRRGLLGVEVGDERDVSSHNGKSFQTRTKGPIALCNP